MQIYASRCNKRRRNSLCSVLVSDCTDLIYLNWNQTWTQHFLCLLLSRCSGYRVSVCPWWKMLELRSMTVFLHRHPFNISNASSTFFPVRFGFNSKSGNLTVTYFFGPVLNLFLFFTVYTSIKVTLFLTNDMHKRFVM